MTTPATDIDAVTALDLELRRQAAALHGELAATQERLGAAEHENARLQADLVVAREQCAAARRELQWLRRAHIDLNRVMDHPVLRAARAAGRLARATARLASRRPRP